MKKSEFIELDQKLAILHNKIDQCLGIVRVLHIACNAETPPPLWAVRDSCSAIDDFLIDASLLVCDCGEKIEGNF
jgi:hypothetical protein